MQDEMTIRRMLKEAQHGLVDVAVRRLTFILGIDSTDPNLIDLQVKAAALAARVVGVPAEQSASPPTAPTGVGGGHAQLQPVDDAEPRRAL